MSDIINSTSQLILPDSFSTITPEENQKSLYPQIPLQADPLQKITPLEQKPLPKKIQNKETSERVSMLPADMPLNEQNLEEIEKELAILAHLSPKQRSSFSDQLMQKKSSELLDPFIEQKFSQLQSLSPEELKPLIEQVKNNVAHLKETATTLKKIDPKKAHFILNALQEISHTDLEHLSSEQQQKLKNILSQLEEQTTALVKTQQLDPKTGNVLLLFLAFAKSQMDQNDKAMLAGMEQVKVKTAQLELNAEEIKNQANQSVEGKHMSKTNVAVIALAVFGLCFLALTGLGALAGMGLLSGTLAIGGGIMASSSLAAGVTAGVLTGLSVGSAALIAYHNPEQPGLEWMTDVGPEDTKVAHSQNLISFFNTQTQKLNSQMASTQKMFVENTSNRSAELGQQAGHAIDTLGQMMKAG